MARHLDHNGMSTVLGVAAITSVLAGVSLSAAAPGLAPAAGPVTPDLLPDPAATDLPDPPFPSGLSAPERQHLQTFDELDFIAFSTPDWPKFAESHAQNVRVHFPDGHYTDGLDKHVEDMQAIFVSSPDAHIKHHPLRIAKGNLTCVTGVMAGTFTRPMPDGKGGQTAPTGKPWSFSMATVGVWNGRGTMDEEWLFYDNETYLSQLGIG